MRTPFRALWEMLNRWSQRRFALDHDPLPALSEPHDDARQNQIARDELDEQHREIEESLALIAERIALRQRKL